jgi:hypothetical protein
VYSGPVGYYSYCYDTIITPDSLIVCGFNAGRYKYGVRRSDVLPPGLYAACRKVGQSGWTISEVDSGDGGLAFHPGQDGTVWAFVIRGSWDKENTSLLKRWTDGGRVWTTVIGDLMEGQPGPRHQFFAQTLHSNSGSALKPDRIYGLLTNQTAVASAEGLFDFDLLVFSITLP